jgi:hypothetical protein
LYTGKLIRYIFAGCQEENGMGIVKPHPLHLSHDAPSNVKNYRLTGSRLSSFNQLTLPGI